MSSPAVPGQVTSLPLPAPEAGNPCSGHLQHWGSLRQRKIYHLLGFVYLRDIFQTSQGCAVKTLALGTWVAQLVKRLPLAQIMISGSWDGAPGQVPCSEGSLLLPLPLPSLAPALILSQIN